VISCPNCDARAPVGARACPSCGCDFVGGERMSLRVRPAVLAGGALAAAAAALAVTLGGGDDAPAPAPDRAGPELLSEHPLSTRAAERLLEARFTSLRDDDSAAARCSARRPEPAHAVRRCRIRYPGGAERTVLLVMNARGRELLTEPR
jgi:hypothetical protein